VSLGWGAGLPMPHRRTFAAGILPILFGTASAARIDLRLAWLGAAHALSPGRSLRASLPFAHSEVAALSPSGLRWPPTPARGHGQPLPRRRLRGTAVHAAAAGRAACLPRHGGTTHRRAAERRRPAAATDAWKASAARLVAPWLRPRRAKPAGARDGADIRAGASLRACFGLREARLEGEPSPGWSHLGSDHAGPSLRGPGMALTFAPGHPFGPASAYARLAWRASHRPPGRTLAATTPGQACGGQGWR